MLIDIVSNPILIGFFLILLFFFVLDFDFLLHWNVNIVHLVKVKCSLDMVLSETFLYPYGTNILLYLKGGKWEEGQTQMRKTRSY